jgi:4-amino-4-deoxy-L-arabinose transferase-like glycosyltransferase
MTQTTLRSKFNAALAALTIALVVGTLLRFYQLGSEGYANLYYAATVKSMLASPSNFFFVASEPGGAVSVDKPPLGFWIQSLFALVLGVNSFSLMLPQALAGVLSIVVLYHLVARRFGSWPGVVSAFALAIMPVVVATDRNNTIDSQLILVLLLATWAFLRAIEGGQRRYLLLGAVLVGLGFNIKMLQAFLPLPAFFAAYLLCAQAGIVKRAINLVLASVVVVVVSLSWAVVVDLTPAANRPYVGSSQTNSVLELALGYNGLSRLFGITDTGRANRPAPATAPGAPVGGPPSSGLAGARGTMDSGVPGLTRLISPPLSKETSWFFLVALVGTLLAGLHSLRKSEAAIRPDLIIWGLWFLAAAIFFSFAQFMHAYYLVMLGAPLAALTGIGLRYLWRQYQQPNLAAKVAGLALLALAIVGSILYQQSALASYNVAHDWVLVVAAVAAVALLASVIVRLRTPALAVAIIALLVVPTVVGSQTGLVENTPSMLPSTSLPYVAGRVTRDSRVMVGAQPGPGAVGAMPIPFGSGNPFNALDQTLLDYLQANTQNNKYMFATSNANTAAPYILATGRPVFIMGGFGGDDPVIDEAGFAKLIADGHLRYVYYSAAGFDLGQSARKTWVEANCQLVRVPNQATVAGRPRYQLYDCQPSQPN